MKIEIEREEDGRWIAEIPELPGVMVYGDTRNQVISKAEALALRVMADRLEHGEGIPELKEVFGLSMSRWPSTKAQQVLAALLRSGWIIKRQHGTSHCVLARPNWPDYVFAFHDREEIPEDVGTDRQAYRSYS